MNSSAPAQSTTIVLVDVSAPEDPYIETKLNLLDWALTAAAVIVVALRIINKTRRRIRLWWDDYIAVATIVVILAFAVVTTLQVHDGAGKHIATLDPALLRDFTLTSNLAATVAVVSTASSKTAFAVTLLKVVEGWPRKAIWVIIYLVNIVSGIAGMCLWIKCTPLKKVFDVEVKGYCWPARVQVAIPILNTSVSGTMDIALSLLGLYLVRQKTTKQGYWTGSLICAGLGIFAGATSYAKAAMMHVLVGNDVTFDIVYLIIWGAVEPAVLTIAGSLPELRSWIWRPSPLTAVEREHRRRHYNFDDDFDYTKRLYKSASTRKVNWV